MTDASDRKTSPGDAVVEQTRMSVGEHLTELRTRLMRSVLALVGALVVTSIYAEDVFRAVVAPFQDVMRDLHQDPALKATGPTTGFLIYFKVSVMAALAVAAPIWLHQLWLFVAAGLYEREKRPILRFLPLSIALFIGGVAFGYFLLLPTALRFLMTFASPDLLQNWIGVSEYLSLFFTLTLLLGAMFELPLVMLGLAKAGIVGSDGFRSKRKIVIIAIFILAGLVTPPDPVTQPLVAVPLCLLYELGIVFAMAAEGKRRTPIDRRALLKRLRFVAIVALSAALLMKPLIGMWRAGRADARSETAASDSGVPWRPAARALLDADPEVAYRLVESPHEVVMLVAAGEKAAALRFRPSRERAVAVPTDGGAFDVLAVQAGAVLWRAESARDLRATDVVDALVEALTDGSEQTRATARRLLAAAFGIGTTVSDEAAAEAARAAAAAFGDRPFAPRDTASRPSSGPEGK